MLESVRRKLDRDPVRERLRERLCLELVREMLFLELVLDKLPRNDPCRDKLLRELALDKLREFLRLKPRRELALDRLRRDPDEPRDCLDAPPPFFRARRSIDLWRLDALDALVETPEAILDIGLSIERRWYFLLYDGALGARLLCGALRLLIVSHWIVPLGLPTTHYPAPPYFCLRLTR